MAVNLSVSSFIPSMMLAQPAASNENHAVRDGIHRTVPT